MNTKKCKNCGWEFPVITTTNTCPWCHVRFSQGTCRLCGQYTYDLGRSNLCTTCRPTWNKKYYYARAIYRRRVIQKVGAQYTEWLARIALVPKPYATLNEAQWLEACSYFGHCALCPSESIDARCYFINFKEGGKYCNWNIIPLCAKCATALKIQKNPFRRMHIWLNKTTVKRYGFTKKALDNVVKYLSNKMEEAINE